ncbi:MAG: pyruvate kinase [Pseudomonadota bacterium]
MRRQRATKIVATLGPASSSFEMICKLYEAGADVFRINMSHTPHDEMRALIGHIRKVEEKFNRPIGILADLQGPKLRIGALETPRPLQPGEEVIFSVDGSSSAIPLPHPEIFRAVQQGHRLLLDDGRLRLTATANDGKIIRTRVDIAGTLSSRKGVSLPDSVLPISAMTTKDHADLEAALEAGVNWIALSFVQRPEDVAVVKEIARGRANIMAKIEKPSALEHLDSIIELADGIMVARGDLGVELPLEKVPGVQKRLTRRARRLGKPCIVATQMLESMISSASPTRAEVSDVAGAVFEGADAVMLSAESAMGQYPTEAVMTMDRIAREVEQDYNYRAIIGAQRTPPEATGSDVIAEAARSIAEHLQLAAIVCYTASGSTALRVARERPNRPVIAFTPSLQTARSLSLCWDVHCIHGPEPTNLDDMVDHACRTAFRENFARPGQRVIVIAGVPLGTPGATNMLRIAYVGLQAEGVID